MIITDTQIILDLAELPTISLDPHGVPSFSTNYGWAELALERRLMESAAALLARRAADATLRREREAKERRETVALAEALGSTLSLHEHHLLDVLGGSEGLLLRMAQSVRDAPQITAYVHLPAKAADPA